MPRPARQCLRTFLRDLGVLRRQEGLRCRRLRRLHGLARRRAGAFLPDAGFPRRRTRGHHHRGARPGRQAASDAAGLPRRAGLPMRLLRRRHDHDRRLARRGAEADLPRARSRAISAAAPAIARSPTRSTASPRSRRMSPARPAAPACPTPSPGIDRHRQGALHHGCRHGGPAAPQGAALASRACAASWRSTASKAMAVPGRGRGLHLGGCPAPALQHGDARGSSGRSRRHLHPRQRGALRRPARRRRRGRDRGRRRTPACRLLEVELRDPARRVRSGRRHGARRTRPARQGRRGERQHLCRDPWRDRQRRGRLCGGRRRARA